MRRLLLLALLSPLPTALAEETVALRADPWCPFTCEPDSPNPGFMIELAQAAFAEHKIKVDYQVLNWARAILETRKGTYQGIVGALPTDAEDFVYHKVAYGQQQSCFYTLPTSTWEFKTMDSLKGVVLGITQNYTYGEKVDDYIRAAQQDKTASKKFDMASGLKPLAMHLGKLQKGRMPVFIEDQSVLGHYLKQEKNPLTVRNAGCLDSADLFLAFSPKNPRSKDYAAMLDAFLAKARKDGKVAKILAKYGLKDWEK